MQKSCRFKGEYGDVELLSVGAVDEAVVVAQRDLGGDLIGSGEECDLSDHSWD